MAKHNTYHHPYYDKMANNLFSKEFIPRFNYTLYHWAPTSKMNKIIHSKALRMTNAYNFEDKDEFVRGIRHIIDSIQVNRHANAKFQLLLGIKAELEKVVAEEEIIPYVTCFTLNKYNKHLKDTYGDGGKGGLFQIKPTRLSTKTFLLHVHVIYDYLSFVTQADKLLNIYADTLSDILIRNEDTQVAFRNIVPLLMRDIFILAISYKHRSFSDEEEVRFINFSVKGTAEYKNRRYLVLPRRFYHLKMIN